MVRFARISEPVHKKLLLMKIEADMVSVNEVIEALLDLYEEEKAKHIN